VIVPMNKEKYSPPECDRLSGQSPPFKKKHLAAF
jgi:hypothetical protein